MSRSDVREFTDPDAFAASFREAVVDLTVIAPGDFNACRIRLELPWSRLLICREALPAIRHVALRPDTACIAFPTRDGEAAIADGARMVMGDVMFWPAGSRFHARTPANAAFACILFDPANWTGKNLAHAGRRIVLPRECRLVRPSRHALRRLLRLCLRARQAAIDTPGLLRDEGAAGELEWALIETALDCLSIENRLAVRGPWRRRSGILNRFAAVLRDSAGKMPAMSELCAAVGVTPRVLATCCRDHLGMGPGDYLALRQRNRLRRPGNG